MPMEEVAFLPKSIMLTICLIAYLLTSFLVGFFNKPEFHYSGAFIAGRVGVCVFIAAVAFLTDFNPYINLVCDTVAVYFALWHEWLLYHGRSKAVAFGRSLGFTDEEMIEAGYTFTTREGRRNIRNAIRTAREAEKNREDQE